MNATRKTPKLFYVLLKSEGLKKRLMLLFLVLFFSFSAAFSATKTASVTGNWSSTTTWGGALPAAGDSVVIADGVTLTVDGNYTCKGIAFGVIGPKAAASLVVNTGFTLTVTNAVNCPASNIDLNVTATYTISGGGTINCTNFYANNPFKPSGSNTTTLNVVTSLNAINISNNLVINSTVNQGNKTNNGYLNFQSGTITVANSVTTANVATTNIGTLDMVTSASSPTLVLNGASPFVLNNTGSSAMNFNGTGSTVKYAASSSQNSVLGRPYTNLTFAGSGTKNILAGASVSGTMSMQGTATAASQPISYGAGATLEYKGSTAQTTSNYEYPTTSGPSALRIDNTLGVTLNGDKSVSTVLTFVNGKINTGINKISLGAGAYCTGAGTGKYINGIEEIYIPNTLNPRDTFFIGDANYFTPIYLGFTGLTSGSGSLTASTIGADHTDILNAGLDANKSVNRNWTITRNAVTGFTSYDITLNFVPQDVDAAGNTANMVIRKLSGTWGATNLTGASATFTSANNMTTVGTYQIGEIDPLSISSQPPNTAACENYSTTISVASPSMPVPDFVWQRDPGIGIFSTITSTTDGGVYTNYNAATLNIANATGLNGYKYRVVLTNINGTVTSSEALLSVTAQPSANISYVGTPFCTTVNTSQSVTFSGSTGGTYSAPGGLAINSTDGSIVPSSSTGGSYLVTYTLPAFSGCPVYTTTTNVVITTMPNATISFPGTPYCTSLSTAQPITKSGIGTGVYSSAAGLNINSSTGSILPSASTAGSYTVKLDVAAAGGCAAYSTTTNVSLTRAPIASITYSGAPFCKTVSSPQAPVLTGDAGGTYSAGAGLVINSTTGEITPSTSAAGTYTVTYTIAGANGCPTYNTTTTVTVTAIPSASISYSGSPFCASQTVAQAVTRIGTAGGSYSAPTGLTINSSTGAVTPSTSTPGTYVVTYTVPASGGCDEYSTTTNVTITAVPTATISYTGNPFCKTVGATEVTLLGTNGGTFSAAAGLTLNTVTGDINPSTSTPGTYTVTYSIAAANGCAAFSTTTSVTVTAIPNAGVSYAGSPYCTSLTTAQAVTLTGTTSGTFSSTSGLQISPTTGAVTPSLSTPGSYTVTYTIPATGGCNGFTTGANVVITAMPSASISYAGTPFCKNVTTPQSITLSGTAGGTFSAGPGLSLDAGSGNVVPSSSNAGTYTVTYTVPAANGCGIYNFTAPVTITAVPSATISYSGTPFCTSVSTAQGVTLIGSTGGTYSAPAGLTIDANTGAITPSNSTPGTYTVTYTIAAAGGCNSYSFTTNVTITQMPSASISYVGSPYCKTITAPQPATQTGTAGGAFSSTAGLYINSGTGEITPSASSGGTYTVTYSLPAGAGCAAYSTTASLVISPIPSATISYTGSPFCTSVTTGQPVTLTGTTGGTYSAAPVGLTINAATGAITPSTSTPGTYTITYSVTSPGCSTYRFTTTVTITAAPVANISYAGTPFCKTLNTPQAVTQTGATGGTYSSSAGLTIDANTGDITPSTSTPGTYTVVYTVPPANGCGTFTFTTTIVITGIPTATLSYAGSPFCTSLTTAQAITFSGTAGGTYSASPAGLTLNATTGAITPSTSTPGTYTITYTITPAGCNTYTFSTTATITAAPVASISYAGTPFCQTVTTPQPVTQTGATGGTYSSTAGLSIDPNTGAITPSASTAGTYTVTYSIPPANGCGTFNFTTTVVISAIPNATISYTGNPYCNTVGNTNITRTGTTGGTFSASPAGLNIKAGNGQINPSSSTPGNYTVNYAVSTPGCATYNFTTNVIVSAPASATISYTTPFCKLDNAPEIPTISGTSGGTFTSTAGLTIDGPTGAVTPSTSTVGTYTITYKVIPPGCTQFSTTTSVTVNNANTASISYVGPFCSTNTTAQAVTVTGTTGGTFSASPAGLSINATTGAILPSASTPGTYTVSYTLPPANGCGSQSFTTTVTITAAPSATFSYAGSPFCTTTTTEQPITFSGTTGGNWNGLGGLIMNSTTGGITPSANIPGTYTVKYVYTAAGGCTAYSNTTSVTISAPPTATISYAGSPYCASLATAQAVTITGTTGGTFSAPAGLSINASTGAITPSASTPGTYTVTYTTPANGGCSAISVTTTVTISQIPSASISYSGNPFCKSITTAQPVTQTGASGGTYSSTAGLTIDGTTGAITPSTSTPGTYTITYTVPAANGCGATPFTTTVTITAIPAATISYGGSPYCTSLTAAQPVTITGTGGGTFSVPAGLTINASTGAVTPSTSTPGTYTVTYTLAPTAGCGSYSFTTNVTISQLPSAAISYAGTPFCKSLVTAQGVAQTGATGGIYTVSPAGLSINGSTGAITPSASTAGTYTVTYTIAAANGCAAVTATAGVTISAIPSATISYTGSPYCTSVTTAQSVTQTGTTGGTYSASPAGLTINTSTGTITPSTSTPGTYTVTYTIAAAGGCSSYTFTTNVTISQLPAATISYAGTPFCKSVSTAQPVTQTGNTGGTYTASPAGLSIDATTGAITPSASTAGTYTVTYTIGAANGCAAVTATASVTITAAPSATISYAGNPFCSFVSTAQPVTVTGTTGGTFSAPAGLTINSGTGAITPFSSLPGNYTVTYTVAAAAGCSAATFTTNVSITAAPSASISYAGSPFCKTVTTAQPVTQNGTTGGTYSASPAGLSINATTGAITPSTSTAGTYTVTYSIAAANGCTSFSTTASVTITAIPSAAISYAGSPYCTSLTTAQPVTLTGTTGGTFSAPAGLTINVSTGAITPSTSTAGTYTVTYTVAAAGGCAAYSFTTSVTISQMPAATITYAGTPFCKSVATAQAVSLTGTTGGTFSASPAGLSINAATGDITPSTSAVGTYTVTYSIAAANGCAAITTTTTVTITAIPSATISYTGTPYCTSLTTGQAVTFSGTTGGSYTASPAGLSIDATTGAINPSASTAGSYTVTYSVTPAGCATFSTTASVVISQMPSATISYAGNPFCTTVNTAQSVTVTGNTGGAFSAAAGLSLNTTTGAVNPSLSTPGTYTVTYTIAAANGCGSFSTTTSVTVTQVFNASINYATSPFCTSDANPQLVTRTGTAGGVFSATPAGLSINAATGSVQANSSTAGTYTIAYDIATAGGCAAFSTTTTVGVTLGNSATISYASPFCSTGTFFNPTFSGKTGGVYSATPAGLSINSTSGQIKANASTPGTYTVSYTLAASGNCDPYVATATVVINTPPSATISYSGTPFCKSVTTAQAVTQTGTAGGTYSSIAGLSINSSTGAITPSLSTAGTYTVTYSMPANGCTAATATTTVTITNVPSATISYAGSPYCTSLTTAQAVTLTGSTGGTYSASPAGLSISTTTGAITPSSSTAGTYTVTYTVAAAGGCAAYSTTATVTITQGANGTTISYPGAPYCRNLATMQAPTISGMTGGTFSSTAGLTLNTTTGEINPSTSTAGTYTVTYSIGANGGCAAFSTTVSVTITAAPSATIAYSAATFCPTVVTSQAVTRTGTAGGTFTASPSGLSITASTGAILPSASVPGTYTVTYYIAATGGCGDYSTTTTVTIAVAPSASFSYAGSPFCKSVTTPQQETFTGTTGGTFSSTAGLTINATTGDITPSTSTAGTYTVTYSVPAGGGCGAYSTTTSVTVTTPPSATISYGSAVYCQAVTTAQSVTKTGTAGGTFSVSPAGLPINTANGQITPSTSTPGTYTVSYNIAASGGCPAYAATTTVKIIAVPTGTTISYSGTPYCRDNANLQTPAITGATGGTFSSTAGLSIDANTGAINPSASTAGTYTVTYAFPASNNCAAYSTTASVTIVSAPAATISYAGSPFCKSVTTAQSITLTGTTGGTYSASPAGLTINATTGAVTPSTSTVGTYTVSYAVAAANGCSAYTFTTTVTITAVPTAAISYSGPYCQTLTAAQSVTQTGSTGGTYTASPAGLSINSATGAITPSASTAGTYTVTYTVAASGGCAAITATANVTITAAPAATISYAGNPMCNNNSTVQNVTLTGSTGGTYSLMVGLVISSSTGAITPSGSTPGTYTVTYTVPASGGCSAATFTTSVTVNAGPSASISYGGSPYCKSLTTAQPVTQSGTTGGTYSAPAGLSINSTTGAITPSTSTAGTYTVTYTVAAANNCAAYSTTTNVTITAIPSATITYAGSPFCNSLTTAQSVTLTGSTGGTYSAPAGLSINSTTGAITPSASTPGTYTVTYTVPPSSGCGSYSFTTSVTITAAPSATIAYSGSPYCKALTNGQPVTLTGTTGGTYTASPAGLTIDAVTGAITPSTSTAGTYTVTYTVAAAGGCAAFSTTANVSITSVPTATISYAGSPFCKSVTTAQAVTQTGATGGSYSAPAGLSINTTTGAVTPSASTAGTYTVTYTVPAANGCGAYSFTTTVTITATPSATISYAGTPFCKAVATAQAVTLTGTTGGTFSSTAGLTLDATTGAITPSTSTAGTYTVTYAVAASGGCAAISTTINVTITTVPSATISYAGTPFCTGLTTAQPVTLTGTTGGTFSAPAGLAINATTGAITPSASTAGTYTVTYTIAAAGGCGVYTFTTNVTISTAPAATISYVGAPFCKTLTTAQAVTLTGTAGGSYSSTAGLLLNGATGDIIPSASTAGTYTVTYAIPAANGCSAFSTSTNVTITAIPSATISYAGTPYCSSTTTAQAVTLTGTTGGVFSAPAGLSINSSTGAITPSTSTPGTYTVTYTVNASGGCGTYTFTTTVTVNTAPSATISYAGLPWCKSLTTDQSVTQTGSGGGTFSASPAGLHIDPSTGDVNASMSNAGSYTVSYTIPAANGCPVYATTTNVTITAIPSATISYAGNPYCLSTATAQPVTVTGTAGGAFSSTTGLTINNTTGAITPSSSTAGTYTVTYTVPPANGCGTYSFTTNVTLNTPPSASISYAGTPYCAAITTAQSVTRTGASGGTYTATPAGLSIDATTGAIIPSASTPRTYAVTYTIPAANGCPVYTTSTNVTVTAIPTASISYASPFCSSTTTAQAVTITGATGGTFTAPTGLSIGASTGAITPSASTPGTYTVTYTVAPNNGCGSYSFTTNVTINTPPSAAISYSGSPYCKSIATAQPVIQTGSTGGTYSASPAGLSIDATTGAITPSASTFGTYTVTYTIPAANGCPVYSTTTSVTITDMPVATLSYPGSPYCNSAAGTYAVTLTGTTGGTFSAPVGLVISSTTGDITPAYSTPGTYTVTYTIPPANGCSSYSFTTTVTIKPNPSATISYTASAFCKSTTAAQPVNQTGTTGGSYSATPAGLSIDATTGAITPSTSTAGTYTVTYAIGAGSGCMPYSITTTVTITAVPTASLSYAASPFCSSTTTAQPVTITASVPGTFSGPAGLDINSTNGDIIPSTSTVGTYAVSYVVPAQGGCAAYTFTTNVTVTKAPSAAISYAGTPFCKSVTTAQPVTQTGNTGGTYTASPGGLTINSATGDITPSTSAAGTYTVNYTVGAANGCPAYATTTSVTVTSIPSATISYAGSPFCNTVTTAQPVTVSGTTGGTFSSTTGLSINATTGAITPSTSTAGTYTVTYTVAPANGCGSYSFTTTVTINTPPTATISYAGSPYCSSLTTAQAVTVTGAAGGTFSALAGLSINTTTGAITPSTSTAGTYTVTYTIPAANGCAAVSTTTSVTISVAPAATISYAATPYCKTVTTAQPVTLTGTTGGTFSASPAGLVINAATGAITPSGSTAGTYTVTYTVAAANGCSAYSTTTNVAITATPSATIAYAGPYCTNDNIAKSVTITGTPGGTFNAGAGLSINGTSGAITPSASTAGTYTVTYSIAAANGCSAYSTTANVQLSNAPSATINYAGSPFCTSVTTAQPVTLTGTTGGSFSSTTGLTINSTTGAITPSTSTAGTYAVTYTVAAASGCAVYTATTTVTITATFSATISYAGGSNICNTSTSMAVTRTGTAGGTYSSTASLSINATTGTINPSASTPGTYTVTYAISASGGCAAFSTTTSVSIVSGSATIAYSASAFCKSVATAQAVTRTGVAGGTYSASPAGLTISSTTGAITPSTSTAGTYTVSYFLAGSGVCPSYTATTTITITPIPSATISYAGGPFCTSTSSIPVTITGTTGGTFSAPAAVSINSTTGTITGTASTAGTYTVTYTVAAAGGCSAVSTTTSVTITQQQTATIVYSATPYCETSSGTATPTITGTTGGVFSYSPNNGNLSFTTSTGAVKLNKSVRGAYTVYYTITGSNGCPDYVASTPFNIDNPAVASISYAGSSFCTNVSTPQNVTQTGLMGGTYTGSTGLSIDATTGAILPSASTVGSKTATYTATNGCGTVNATAAITITQAPTASISYAGNPFCALTTTAQAVTRTGQTGGTYSATPTGLSINSTTGAISPSQSTSGTYTVTYSFSNGGLCATTTTTTVTIYPAPTVDITYNTNPFCSTNSTPQQVTQTGQTGGTYTAPAGVAIDQTTGAITPSLCTPGTYNIAYTVVTPGCGSTSTYTTVTIEAQPAAAISYPGSPYCGSVTTSQPVNLNGTAGGTYTSTTGLLLDAVSGVVTPSGSTAGTYTVTYAMARTTACPAASTTTTVTINPTASANISYPGSPYCTTVTTAQPVTRTGTSGGTYSAPAGLSINTSTGTVTPSTSTAGTYTVTYSVSPGNGCAAYTTTATVSISALPTASITYPGSPYCKSVSTAQTVLQSGASGGTYSAPAGLSINTSTGAITPAASTAGTYTVSYTVPAANGCASITATTTVTISTPPTAGISYAGQPYCKTDNTTRTVTRTGNTGGTYSSTAGLSINSSTGDIVPASSTPGTYTVTYTIPAANGCADYTATATVTINSATTATVAYGGSPFCRSLGGAQPVTVTGATGGTFSSTVGLSLDNVTGTVTPSSSTAGSYTVTYTVPAMNGCTAFTTTTPVVVTAVPTATINYPGSPFCSTVSVDQQVTQSGATGGSYSSTTGLSINPSTGAIRPSSSTSGGYTVTYTIPATGGCAAVATTAPVSIKAAPTASISYSNSVFCKNITTAQPAIRTGTSGGTFSSASQLVLDPSTGAVTPSASNAGTYTVAYIVPASGGCAAYNTSTSITISQAPSATISYAGSPFCKGTNTPQSVSLVGSAGGAFSSTPGLAINTGTGAILPSGSTGGTYVVTYAIPATTSCGSFSTTTTVAVSDVSSGTIAYTANPYCSNGGVATVTNTANPGGTYSSTSGLAINTTTGAVDLANSTPGSYTVNYTIAASGACSSYTTTATITINQHAIWTGTVSTQWHDYRNWTCGGVPAITSNVVIPTGLSRYPVIDTGIGLSNNIRIDTGATIKVLRQLTIAGNITNAGKVYADSGAVELRGNTIQVIPAAFFANNLIKDFIIYNPGGVTLSGPLNVKNCVAFGNVNNSVLNTGGYLTLLSTLNCTAQIKDLTNGGTNSGNAISGEVTVERYIPPKRAYRFLTSPVNSTASIRSNWMEGGLNSGYWNNSNPNPGYGTNITGPGGNPNGFDFNATGYPSMFYFDQIQQKWFPIPNTHTNVSAGTAYRIIVRGDRSVDMSTNTPPPTPTTIRAKGTVLTGNVNFKKAGAGGTAGLPPLCSTVGGYSFIGNPYPSVVDWTTATRTDIAPTMYMWDPTLTGTNGRGAFVCYNHVLGVNNNSFSQADCFLQSGQGFFVQTTGPNPTLGFKETDKTNINRTVFRSAQVLPHISIKLALPQTSATEAADGVGVFFDSSFNDSLGEEDSYKFTNLDENMGIISNGTLLSLEGRKTLSNNDTIKLKMWQLTSHNYHLKVNLAALPADVEAYLEDNYLNARTKLINDAETLVAFDITTDTLSSMKERFRIVFQKQMTLPVHMLGVKAIQQNEGVDVRWTAEAEENIERYEVERSKDANRFEKVGTVRAKTSPGLYSNYNWFDLVPNKGDNFYRVKAIGKSGDVKYSNIARVRILAGNSTVNVYPNPVTGKFISLVLNDIAKGEYDVTVTSSTGQKVFSTIVNHPGGSVTHTLRLFRQLAGGFYQLKVSGNGTNETVSIMVTQ